MSHERIVCVEDEIGVRTLIEQALIKEGFDVAVFDSGDAGLDEVRTRRPDLVLLDVMLPGTDGMEICRQLKWDPATRSIPVVLLTGRTEESDVVLGLGLGADDYIVKPFRVKELVARVKAVLRRSSGKLLVGGSGVIERGPLVVDMARHHVTVDGQVVRFTPTEIRLLHALALRPGTVLPRADLIDRIGPGDGDTTERTIDVHIQSIRRKLGDHRDIIQTVRGLGYQFLPLS